MTTLLRFWGVRGSIPTPGPNTAVFGGNTSCVEVRCGEDVIILDGGTGLRELGDDLASSTTPVETSILFSHAHWDHIQGMPFFAPGFSADSKLHLFGSPEGGTLEELLHNQMSGPHFPVDLHALPAEIDFNPVEVGTSFRIGRHFAVTAARLNHPGGVLAYRVEALGRSIVYATDTEHSADGTIDQALVALAEDADVLIYDAQYTPAELDGVDGTCRRGWGHSTWVEAVRVADAARVDRLILFHHDPARDDRAVAAIESQARRQRRDTVAAREGMELALEASFHRRAA